MRKAFFLLPALALAMAPAVMAQTATTFPNTLPASFIGNSWPFNNSTAAGFRTQFIYDGSMVPSAGPVLISRLRFRRSSLTATNTGLLNAVTMSLSTSPSKWNAVSATFANNVGKDAQVIFKGNLVCNATAWYIDIKLTTPFLYDPTKGSLCFDFVRGPTPPAGNTYPGAPGYVRGTAAAPFKANRVWGPPTAAAGSLDSTATAANGYASCAEISWIPAKGLYSSFAADKTSGPGPLTVQFTDKTYSSAGPVKTWAWDLDGDSKIDSTLQNPKFTYPKTGFDAQYDVTLTTTDGTHPPSKLTQKAFITVDPSNATAVNFGTGSSNKALLVPMEVPAFVRIYSATAIRGLHFVAPTTFVINGFEAPNDATPKGTDQTIACYVLSTPPTGSFTATAADVKFYGQGKAGTILKPAKPIIVNKGDWVGVFGAVHQSAANAPFQNSYGNGPYSTTILGQKTTLNRLTGSDIRTTKGLGTVGVTTGIMGRTLIHIAGNTAVPTLDTIGKPVLGQSCTLDLVGRVPAAQGGVVFLSSGRLPAPVPTMFGNLLVVPTFAAAIAVPTGTGKLPLPIPANKSLTGVKLDWQALVFNLTSQTYGMSNGTEWFLGKN